MSKSIKIAMLLVITLITFGCEKYERNNPNDLLNDGDGTPVLSFAKYTVIKESGGDMYIQKGEEATVELFIKNEGEKYTTLKTVEITSANQLVTNINFKIGANPICYVGKDNPVGSLAFKLSNDVKAGDVLPLAMTLTDVNGVITLGEVRIIVDAVSVGGFQITYKDMDGYDDMTGGGDQYCAAYTPRLTFMYKNVSGKRYEGSVKYIINSTDPQYPYHYEEESINYSDPGEETSVLMNLDCINTAYHSGQNLPFSITIVDKDSKANTSEIVVPMLPDMANITFQNPTLVTVFKAGQPFNIYVDLTNTANSRTVYISDITVSSNSGYAQNLAVRDVKSVYLSPGTNITQAFRVYGTLASNCPAGVPITFTTTVNLTPTNCGPSKSFSYQFTGVTQ